MGRELVRIRNRRDAIGAISEGEQPEVRPGVRRSQAELREHEVRLRRLSKRGGKGGE